MQIRCMMGWGCAGMSGFGAVGFGLVGWGVVGLFQKNKYWLSH